jgi:hypothetical protein
MATDNAAVANAGFATHDDLATGDPAGWREMVSGTAWAAFPRATCSPPSRSPRPSCGR